MTLRLPAADIAFLIHSPNTRHPPKLVLKSPRQDQHLIHIHEILVHSIRHIVKRLLPDPASQLYIVDRLTTCGQPSLTLHAQIEHLCRFAGPCASCFLPSIKHANVCSANGYKGDEHDKEG